LANEGSEVRRLDNRQRRIGCQFDRTNVVSRELRARWKVAHDLENRDSPVRGREYEQDGADCAQRQQGADRDPYS